MISTSRIQRGEKASDRKLTAFLFPHVGLRMSKKLWTALIKFSPLMGALSLVLTVLTALGFTLFPATPIIKTDPDPPQEDKAGTPLRPTEPSTPARPVEGSSGSSGKLPENSKLVKSRPSPAEPRQTRPAIKWTYEPDEITAGAGAPAGYARESLCREVDYNWSFRKVPELGPVVMSCPHGTPVAFRCTFGKFAMVTDGIHRFTVGQVYKDDRYLSEYDQHYTARTKESRTVHSLRTEEDGTSQFLVLRNIDYADFRDEYGRRTRVPFAGLNRTVKANLSRLCVGPNLRD
jgi:hypothetical protein